MQLLHHLTQQKPIKRFFFQTHDLELALQIADKIWLMDKVNGITSGTPEDLALEGYLSRFFARKGINFSTWNQDFSASPTIIGTKSV